jgi:hypothetical protein
MIANRIRPATTGDDAKATRASGQRHAITSPNTTNEKSNNNQRGEAAAGQDAETTRITKPSQKLRPVEVAGVGVHGKNKWMELLKESLAPS